MEEYLPEGFVADPDGSFKGIPAWCMREGNMIAGSLINKRPWDVPCIADAIFAAYKKGLSEKQRTVYHVACGDDTWTPTADELSDVVKCFVEASSVGEGMAVVATRHGITAYVQRLALTGDTEFVAYDNTSVDEEK